MKPASSLIQKPVSTWFKYSRVSSTVAAAAALMMKEPPSGMLLYISSLI